MINKGYIYYKENATYSNDIYFRPSIEYPEYQYKQFGVSTEPNHAYEMIRNMFIDLELDKENIGKAGWNPLQEYISLNDVVLIKPNLVKHYNGVVRGKKGLECLITHASVIRCIIDYVLIALKGTGRVLVADAPVQSCDFEKLKIETGITRLENFYKLAGKNIKVEDLRNYRSIRKDGCVMSIPLDYLYDGKIVNLGRRSYFYGSNSEGRFRITNYDYRELNRHHKGTRQEYCVSEACLQADVIFNLPKPKTHGKAGFTGALKNMIGINARKDFLPHHTKGSYVEGKGDEYYGSSQNAKVKSNINDVIDILNKKSLFRAGKLVRRLGKSFVREENIDERYTEGSWWGNDTIWRTILDINLIAMYADKHGRIGGNAQRRIITIGDMIISGEGNGPLCPVPKETGWMIFADNSVLFDEILVKMMGFPKEKFVLLRNAEKNKRLKYGEYIFKSNLSENVMKVNDLHQKDKFVPADGWKGYLD